MEKKWIVIPSLLVLAALGAVAVMPVHFWHQFKSQPEVAVDHAMRVKVVDTLVARLNEHYILARAPGAAPTWHVLIGSASISLPSFQAGAPSVRLPMPTGRESA